MDDQKFQNYWMDSLEIKIFYLIIGIMYKVSGFKNLDMTVC